MRNRTLEADGDGREMIADLSRNWLLIGLLVASTTACGSNDDRDEEDVVPRADFLGWFRPEATIGSDAVSILFDDRNQSFIFFTDACDYRESAFGTLKYREDRAAFEAEPWEDAQGSEPVAYLTGLADGRIEVTQDAVPSVLYTLEPGAWCTICEPFSIELFECDAPNEF